MAVFMSIVEGEGFFRDSNVADAPFGRVRSSRFRIFAKHRSAFRIPHAIYSSISLPSRIIKTPFRALDFAEGEGFEPSMSLRPY